MCQFVWSRPVDYEFGLPQLCTDASGRCHGVSIPPPLIRPELIRELTERAAAQLAPQIATLVERAAQPILSPIFDLESPRIVGVAVPRAALRRPFSPTLWLARPLSP